MLWLMRRYCSIFGHAYGRIFWDQNGRKSLCARCGESIYQHLPSGIIEDETEERDMKGIALHSSDLASMEIDGHKVEVQSVGDAVFLRLEGYGTAVENEGWPIRIDWFHGHPTVYLWADIKQEDPTHEISLEEALEVEAHTVGEMNHTYRIG